MLPTKEWLDGLKPGDAVVVRGRGFNTTPRLHTVTRRTPTQIIIDTGGRFRATTGAEIIGRSVWHPVDSIEPLTDDVKAEIARARALRCMNSVTWRNLPDDVLIAIERIINNGKDAA